MPTRTLLAAVCNVATLLNAVHFFQDLFQISVAAAAGVTVDNATLELSVPIPGFDEIRPWIPSLKMGNETTDGFQALVKKEKNVSPTSARRGRAMKEIDRRKLEAMIPSDSNNLGLRMLSGSADDLLSLDIDCDVDTSANEYACAKFSEIRLDVSV